MHTVLAIIKNSKAADHARSVINEAAHKFEKKIFSPQMALGTAWEAWV